MDACWSNERCFASRNSCRCLRRGKRRRCPDDDYLLSSDRNALREHGEAFPGFELKITALNALHLLSMTQRLLQAFPSCTQLEGDSQRRPSRTEGWTNPGDEERKWEETNQEFILHFLSLEYCLNLPYHNMSGNRNVKGRHCSSFWLLHNVRTTALDKFQVYGHFTKS